MAALQVGTKVRFKGYSEAPVAGDPTLEVGDIVIITAADAASSAYTVVSEREDSTGERIVNNLFDDEFELDDAIEQDETPAPKAKKGKKAKAEAPVEVAAPAPKATKKAKKVAKPAAEEAAPFIHDGEVLTDDLAPIPEISEEALDDILSTRGDIAPSEGVAEQIKLYAGDVHAAARALIDQGERTDFTLGGILYEIHDGNWFNKVTHTDGKEVTYGGKRGFQEYIKEELGIGYRKAMYLIDIYKAFRRHDIDERRLQRIGWSKAKVISQLAKDKFRNADGEDVLDNDLDELLEFAESNTREDLVNHVSSRYVNAEAVSRIKKVQFRYTLSGDAAENVKSIVERTAHQMDGDTNAAFESIVTEWAMLQGNMSLDQAIAQLQNTYGVRLSVVETEEAPAATENAA
jgi:hypothetical protein